MKKQTGYILVVATRRARTDIRPLPIESCFICQWVVGRKIPLFRSISSSYIHIPTNVRGMFANHKRDMVFANVGIRGDVSGVVMF